MGKSAFMLISSPHTSTLWMESWTGKLEGESEETRSPTARVILKGNMLPYAQYQVSIPQMTFVL